MKLDINSLWERILFYVSVPTCVCCKKRLDFNERALCTTCLEKHDKLKFRNCSRCSKKLHQCSCSNEYLENHYIKKLAKVFYYTQRNDMMPLNSLIYSLKRDNRNDVLDFCSDELAKSILNSFPKAKDYIFTNVPRSKKAIIKYGIDHAQLLAKRAAEKIGAKYENILISNVKTEQKKLHGTERILNTDFSVCNDIDLKGKTVIIVDDIVTTGSSMSGAAMLIHGQGASKIFGAALGIAYKDKYKPFNHIKYIRLK